MRMIGTFPYLIDRDRVPIPPKFRSLFDPVAYVTNGALPCVVIRTPDGYAAEEAKVESWPDELEEAKLDFFSSSAEKTLDSQGRISLDQVHIQHAGLTREVLVIGAKTELQVWDKATWEKRAPDRQAAVQVARFGAPKPGLRPATAEEPVTAGGE